MIPYRRHLSAIRFSAHSKWVYGLLFPWFLPLIGYLTFGWRYFGEWAVFGTATAINLSMGTVTFFTMDALVVAISRRYPGLKQTLPRVTWMLVAFAVITTAVILSGFWLYTSFSILGFEFNYGKVREMLILNFMANIVSVGAYECIYSATEWKASMLEKEQKPGQPALLIQQPQLPLFAHWPRCRRRRAVRAGTVTGVRVPATHQQPRPDLAWDRT
jgi:hypothetical protein